MRFVFVKGFVWIPIILSLLLPGFSVHETPLFSASVSLDGPYSCPNGGCAAGQRLNLQTSFDLTTYLASETDKNIQFCVYTPFNWDAEGLSVSPTGLLSGETYQPDNSACNAAPNGYENIGGSSAIFNVDFFGDSLLFSLRIGKTATTDGSILIKILEFDGSSWQQTQQAFILIPVTPLSTTAYVANQASECGSYFPCFVNSKDDLINGLGTGLKDAVDALSNGNTIQILGNYQIKDTTILINKTLTIQGGNQASITYNGTNCTNPMLKLTNGGMIRSLFINDGTCSLSNRDLILVESNADTTIEQNTLTQGKNAVLMMNSNGNLIVRFNHFLENRSFAIANNNTTQTGSITAIANNFILNNITAQVECANHGTVDYNFWGAGQTPASASSNCDFTTGRNLGNLILPRTSGGVDAIKTTITNTQTAYFNQKLFLKHLSEDPDFDLYLINYGDLQANTPYPQFGTSLVPCNNFYHFFLSEQTAPQSTLIATLKYDANNACIAMIESGNYCGQSNPSLFPLWWLDPLQEITNGWDTTGQIPSGPLAENLSGQTTTCNLEKNELILEIDASGRPNIENDLFNLPLVPAVIGQSAAAVLSDFSVLPQDMQVKINWETNSELNTTGFYVQRSPLGETAFSRVSPFLARQGNNTSGAVYEYLDTTVVNFTGYDYRLEIVGTDLFPTFSSVLSAIPSPPTATPTITLTSTTTLTPTITITPTVTITSTRTISTTPTITRTSTITPTRTRTRARTPTPTRTAYWTPFRTRTATRTPFITRTPARTFTSTATRTATFAGTNANAVGTSSPGSGYPIPGSTDSISTPSTNNGYPNPDPENLVTISPTPPPQNATLESTQNVEPTQIDQESSEPENRKNGTIAYIVLGGMVGLSLLLIVAFILWKKGVLPLPF